MRRFIIPGSVLLLLIVGAWYFDIARYVQPELLKATILEYGHLAPLLFVLAYTIATVLFIPGTPLTLLGGVLFGPWWGTLWVVMGASIGAILAFLLARFVGGRFVSLVPGSVGERLRAYDERLKNKGFMTVLILRLVPLFPFNGLNVALGFTSVRTRDYALATVIGIMPGTAAYVYFGSAVATLSPVDIAIAIGLILVLILVGRIFSKRIT